MTLGWATDTLRRLVELESPSGSVDLLDACRNELIASFGAAGVVLDIVPGPTGDHLVGSWGPLHGAPVVVLGHYDTVWPAGSFGASPFVVDGELATGPGVFDMKGGIVALLHAIRSLPAGPLHPVRIVLVADEEVGSPSGAAVVEQECAGAAAVLALESPLAEGTLKVGRRGVARVRLDVTGRAAHAGLDAAAGVSAIDELVDQLGRLRAAAPDSPDFSLNVGRISGGTRANVVAAAASAELGLRFVDDDAETVLRRSIAALTPIRPGATLDTTVLSRRPAWEPTASKALAAHVLAVAGAVGEPRLRTAVSGGAGDANLTGALGIPTVDGLGPRGHGAHAPDETVELPSILQRGELLAALLTRELP